MRVKDPNNGTLIIIIVRRNRYRSSKVRFPIIRTALYINNVLIRVTTDLVPLGLLDDSLAEAAPLLLHREPAGLLRVVGLGQVLEGGHGHGHMDS